MPSGGDTVTRHYRPLRVLRTGLKLATVRPVLPSQGGGGGGGVVWRGQEPVGYTQLANRDFNATSEDGWSVAAAGGSVANFTIVTDPTAPRSPSNVGQINYPHIWSDTSAEPCIVFKGVSLRKLYFCKAFMFSGNWVGHPTGTNKICHYYIDTAVQNRIFSAGYGDAGNPMLPVFGLQALPSAFNFPAQGGGFATDTAGWLFPNQAGHTADQLVRGTWNQWEALMDLGTSGNADGSIQWWINGVLIGSYINIPLIQAGGTNAFGQIGWAPTWGGGGANTLTVDQQQFMDAYYASGHA